MIKIKVTDRAGELSEIEAPTDMNFNLMEILKSYEFPVKGTCGGMALCASCHVYVESNHHLHEMEDGEIEMLDAAFFVKSNSRLACQLKLNDDMDGLEVTLAPETED
jgi:2Fe-2S ferredoxin